MDWLVSNGLGWLPWRWALVIALAMGLVMLAARMQPRWRSVSSGAGEVALLMVAYAAWQYAGSFTFGGLDRAVASGRQVARVEELLGWPSGAAIQAPVLGHEWVMRAADTYYATAHITVFIITLSWVFLRHREDWPFTRTTVFLTTGACLLIQYKPVAPPRLIPELGVVDTAARTGLSVYTAIPGANQYSAMPSVHIAWAAAVALLIIVIARSPWRWAALVHPLATTWVVVVTGNHYLMDAVVAVILLAGACAVTLAIPSQTPQRYLRYRQQRATTQMQREPDTVTG
jgi:hypothetical protein